jgi:hypothetical protein
MSFKRHLALGDGAVPAAGAAGVVAGTESTALSAGAGRGSGGASLIATYGTRVTDG